MKSKGRSNAEGLLSTGETMYRFSKPFVIALFVGIGFLIVICLLVVATGDGDELPLYLSFMDEDNPMAILFVAVSYLFISAGILAMPFFFMGLHYIGLGQIALNTLPADEHPVYEPQPAWEPAAAAYTPAPQPAPAQHYEAPAFVAPIQETPPAPVVPPTAPAPASQPVENKKYSMHLYNYLKKAVETTTDEELINRLEYAASKLSAPHEKQLIRQIMNRPSTQIRPMVEKVFQEFSRAVQPQ